MRLNHLLPAATLAGGGGAVKMTGIQRPPKLKKIRPLNFSGQNVFPMWLQDAEAEQLVVGREREKETVGGVRNCREIGTGPVTDGILSFAPDTP